MESFYEEKGYDIGLIIKHIGQDVDEVSIACKRKKLVLIITKCLMDEIIKYFGDYPCIIDIPKSAFTGYDRAYELFGCVVKEISGSQYEWFVCVKHSQIYVPRF